MADETTTPLQKQAVTNLREAIIGVNRAYDESGAILLDWVVLARWRAVDGVHFSSTVDDDTDPIVVEGLVARMSRQLDAEALLDELPE